MARATASAPDGPISFPDSFRTYTTCLTFMYTLQQHYTCTLLHSRVPTLWLEIKVKTNIIKYTQLDYENSIQESRAIAERTVQCCCKFWCHTSQTFYMYTNHRAVFALPDLLCIPSCTTDFNRRSFSF